MSPEFYRHEIMAEAFRRMTGHMAPGKDASPLSYPAPIEERRAAWDIWCDDHSTIIHAMFHAVESVQPEFEGLGLRPQHPEVG